MRRRGSSTPATASRWRSGRRRACYGGWIFGRRRSKRRSGSSRKWPPMNACKHSSRCLLVCDCPLTRLLSTALFAPFTRFLADPLGAEESQTCLIRHRRRRSLSVFIRVHPWPINLSHLHDRSPLRMYSRRPAPAFRQVDLHLGILLNRTLDQLVVARHPAGVYAVLVGLHAEASLAQEPEVNLQIPRRPVGHGADVPVAALAARHHHVLRDFRFRSE